jgi:hypothetical protein
MTKFRCPIRDSILILTSSDMFSLLLQCPSALKSSVEVLHMSFEAIHNVSFILDVDKVLRRVYLAIDNNIWTIPWYLMTAKSEIRSDRSKYRFAESWDRKNSQKDTKISYRMEISPSTRWWIWDYRFSHLTSEIHDDEVERRISLCADDAVLNMSEMLVFHGKGRNFMILYLYYQYRIFRTFSCTFGNTRNV